MVQCTPESKKEGTTGNPISEISHRLELIKDRITNGNTPTINNDFILAEITLDPALECRFVNYSGDQTERYFTALSMVKRAYFKIYYCHDSMYETSMVILRPISENT